ncbi:MAG: 50S ribosomal protein L18 [Vicinamibacterales bacterium]
MRIKTTADRRQRIRYRLRKRTTGTAARPRLSLFRSVSHIYVQAIDDATGQTLVSASTMDAGVKARLTGGARGGNVAGAALVGTVMAERLREKGITQVVFDRGGFLYHGRVKAVADAARSAGLEF